MPKDKDLKRVVRTRMEKTGESYTAARRRILAKPSTPQSPTAQSPTTQSPESQLPESQSPESRSPTPQSPATQPPDLPSQTPQPPDPRANAAQSPATQSSAAQSPAADPPGARTAVAEPAAADLATRAGMSDQAVRAKTGRSWKEWVAALDTAGAASRPHPEIARQVQAMGVGSWWSQTVAVGYERIHGLRQIGQRRDGTYEASKSRTYPVPLATLYAAWSDPAKRRRWLTVAKPVVAEPAVAEPPGAAPPGAEPPAVEPLGVGGTAEPTVRRATENRSLRLAWPDGTSVEVGFFAKGESRSQVAIQHGRVGRRADADRLKREWSARLDALGVLLAAGADGSDAPGRAGTG